MGWDIVKVDMRQYALMPNNGLKVFLNKQRHGQPDEYRTTFYDRRNVSEVVNGWWEVAKGQLSDKPVFSGLVRYEEEMLAKVGPLSVQQPLSQRMDSIKDYFMHTSGGDPIIDAALDLTIREFTRGGALIRRSERKTIEAMDLSKNSGLPTFRKKKDVIQETFPYHLRGGSVQLPTGQFVQCAVLGWRGQEGGPDASDVKQRVLWMFPFYANVAELSVYQPIINAGARLGVVPAWSGNDAVDFSITELFNSKDKSDYIIGTDFTGFDQHFNDQCQIAGRKCIQSIVQMSEEWCDMVYPVKYNIPLLFDWGQVIKGHHGMASGSGGTNCDETLVHRALQHEAAAAKHQRLYPGSQCLGDDGIISYPGIRVDDVLRSYTRHGLEMNDQKQWVSQSDTTYLRRWYSGAYRIGGVCRGVYPTCRALGRLCEQERWYDNWDRTKVALRQLSIIENCRWHPLRNEFAEYCIRGDRYRLGIDIPGFLDNIAAIAEESNDEMNDFMSYSSGAYTGGIASWWIVQWLKERAKS